MDEQGGTAVTAVTAVERERLVGRTRALLRDGVPLSLLLDLADAAGPDSAGRFVSEPADLGWLRKRTGSDAEFDRPPSSTGRS